MNITRRGAFGALVAGVVGVCAKPVKAARQWTNIKRKHPKVLEYGQVDYFSGEELEIGALPAKIDGMVGRLRDILAKNPDFNLWRTGTVSVRMRTGQAETAEDWAIARGERTAAEPVWTLVRVDTCETCKHQSQVWAKDGQIV